MAIVDPRFPTLVSNEGSEFVRSVVRRFPRLREDARREVLGLLELGDRQRAASPSGEGPSFMEKVRALHDELVDRSLGGQLEMHVGAPPFSAREPTGEIRALAKGLAGNVDDLAAHFPWLTSGDARGAWLLGWALADEDPHRALLPFLLKRDSRGPHLALITAYLTQQQQHAGASPWLDDVLDAAAAEPAPDYELVFEASLAGC